MNTLPSLATRKLTPEELSDARAKWEVPRLSPWASHCDSKELRKPSVLPVCYGDGLQPVLVSFFAAPEVMTLKVMAQPETAQ